NNPSDYLGDPAEFANDISCGPTSAAACTFIPAGDGSFSQNIQRLGLYFQDSWRATRRLTVNYGLRWDTTFGLFDGSGRTQAQNPAFLTLQQLGINLVNRTPDDYRKEFGPRLGIAYALGEKSDTVIRAGIGLYYNDLAQNGWV